jgi:hypothetical protein
MQISICSISKLSVAHLTRNTTKLSAFTIIIGRILDENLIFLRTIAINYARTGRQVPLLLNIKMDVLIWHHANAVMGGKNKTIILSYTRQSHVLRKRQPNCLQRAARNAQGVLNVLIITQRLKKDILIILIK